MTDRLLASHSRFVPYGRGDRIKVRGGWLSFLALGEETGGAYALIETANDPATRVRLHVHEREDETWFVLEGEYTFEVGGAWQAQHLAGFRNNDGRSRVFSRLPARRHDSPQAHDRRILTLMEV